MAIYTGQSRLYLELDTFTDLTNMASAKICYKKPDGTSGYWTAVRSGTGTNTKIRYVFAINTAVDVVGVWTAWAEITFTDSRVGLGDPFTFEVKTPGTV
jgi:hypothetical protein